jgi:methionyl-tRNA formyltransferase
MDSRIIFFGTAEFSVPTLNALIAAGHNVVAVVTKPDSPAGRGRKLERPPVATVADTHGIPVLQPSRITDDFGVQIQEFKPDIGIVVAYGKIIPQEIIDVFPGGLINIHSSLLPQYRGPSPIEAAIVNGDTKTGVTIMKIDAGMDSGPLYAQREIRLHGDETRPKLYDRLSQMGAELLVEILSDIIDGKLAPKPQDNRQATTVPLVQKSDGIIDWYKPADRLEREIRGYLGWPGSRTTLFDTEITITAARVVPGTGEVGEILYDTHPDHPLFVYCREGALVIDRLKPAGKNEMTASAFLRGRNL